MTVAPPSGDWYRDALDAERGGDDIGAREILRRAAAADHPSARLALAGMMLEGRGGPVESSAARAVLAPLVQDSAPARRMISVAIALDQRGDGGWPRALAYRITHALAGEVDPILEIGLLLTELGTRDDLARQWLAVAAGKGSGLAVAALARLAAAQGGVWPGLVAQVRATVAMRHPIAPQLLAACAGLPETVAPPAGDLERADALDSLAALEPTVKALPDRITLCPAPEIHCSSGLIRIPLCDYLIAASYPLQKRARVFDPGMRQTREDPYRRSHSATIPQSLMDLPFLYVQSRMAALGDADLGQAEPLGVLLYQPGDEYLPHFDYFTGDGGWATAELADRGQRLATSLVALNDSFTGGETHFPRVNVSWRGSPGDALIFRNLDATGTPDPNTLHAGRPVVAGWKALASVWLRERRIGSSGTPVRRT